MMADSFGKVLVTPQKLTHQSSHFKFAVVQIREAQKQFCIDDLIGVFERRGN